MSPPRRALEVAAVLASLLCARDAAAEPPDPDPWLGPDKALHFAASALIGGGGYAASALFFDDRAARVGVGVGLGLTAGVLKEALDAAGLGHPSWKDLAWDVAGTAVGVGIALSLDLAVSHE